MTKKISRGILIATGIFPPEIGGPASYAELLADCLSKAGIKVTVATYAKQFRSAKNSRPYSFKVIRTWSKWPIWVKHTIFGIKLLVQAKRSDVVYSLNAWSVGAPAFFVAKFYRKKFVIKIVGDYAWEIGVNTGRVNLMLDDFQKSNKRGWINLLWYFQTHICRRADLVIVPSEYLAGIVQGWGVSSAKIRVVYNAVNFVPSDLSREEARKEIGIAGNIVTSAGRLVPWKGFRMLVKIMPQLIGINQFFRLVIIGDGPDRAALEAMVRNMGLEKKVFLVGRKNHADMATYLAASDVFVLNSGYEGFSHQLLEVLKAGVPIIASAIGGNREAITSQKNGFLVKYNDEFNLIEAIKGLWQIPELRDQFVKEGRKTAERFTVDRMIQETVSNLLAI